MWVWLEVGSVVVFGVLGWCLCAIGGRADLFLQRMEPKDKEDSGGA